MACSSLMFCNNICEENRLFFSSVGGQVRHVHNYGGSCSWGSEGGIVSAGRQWPEIRVCGREVIRDGGLYGGMCGQARNERCSRIVIGSGREEGVVLFLRRAFLSHKASSLCFAAQHAIFAKNTSGVISLAMPLSRAYHHQNHLLCC